MNLYNFTVHLDHSPSDDDFDRLYEAGLDDCLPVADPNGSGQLLVARRADALTEAILSVVADLTKAGFHAVGIDAEDLVTQEVIGQRTGRTRESVRLLALGKRGPGGFPAPAVRGRAPLYSWAATREWFRTHYGDDVAGTADRDADTLAAADLLLRARMLAPDASELSRLVTA